MEKPAPLFDRYPRYQIKTYDRMIPRQIPVVSDIRSETDKPVWKGDHAFSSDAAAYSLMNFIEPEVVREHKDWDISKVREEARDRFTKRLAQDLSYEDRETHHEETIVRWKPIETDHGLELATEYGDRMITLRELWEHTKEYAAFVGNPKAYNKDEERAQLAMQDALIFGTASGFVSVLSHPDSVRYIQVWEKNSDGEVTSKQVDLHAATGRDFSRVESDQLIEHLSILHHETRQDSYAAFLVEHGTVNEQSIRLIATGLVMSTEAAPMDLVSVTRDVSDSRILLGKYLHEEISQTLRVLKTENGKKEIKKKNVIEHKFTNTGVLKQKHQIEKIEVKKIMAEWVISQTMIHHALDIPTGSHAALYWFRSLEYQKAETKVVEKPMTKSKQVHLIRRLLTPVFDGLKKIILTESGSIIKIRSVEKEKPAVIMRIKDVVRVFITKSSERVLKLIYFKPHVSEQKTLHIPESMEEQPIKEVRIAFIVWRIFVQEKPKDRQGMIHIVFEEQKEMTTNKEESYVPIWVLLAIIRYLALLRESGGVKQATPVTGVRPKRNAAGSIKFTPAS